MAKQIPAAQTYDNAGDVAELDIGKLSMEVALLYAPMHQSEVQEGDLTFLGFKSGIEETKAPAIFLMVLR